MILSLDHNISIRGSIHLGCYFRAEIRFVFQVQAPRWSLMQPNTPKIQTEKNVFKDNFQARERKFYSPLIIGRQLKDNAKK